MMPVLGLSDRARLVASIRASITCRAARNSAREMLAAALWVGAVRRGAAGGSLGMVAAWRIQHGEQTRLPVIELFLHTPA
jgi:hypothetical protein